VWDDNRIDACTSSRQYDLTIPDPGDVKFIFNEKGQGKSGPTFEDNQILINYGKIIKFYVIQHSYFYDS